jgi:hypothetical protein
MTLIPADVAKYALNSINSIGGKAPFTDVSQMNVGQTFIFLIIFLIVLIFIMWVGAYIFNHSLVKIFPSVNKASLSDFIGLYIVVHILFC